MTLTDLRRHFGFCAAIAVIAAAVADPIVEFGSNAGLFGAGRYTDHSNLDVVPALLAGCALLALYLMRRAPAILRSQALTHGVVRLLPTILILQLAALFLMETAEQVFVYGHPLGSTIWVGAPIPISLAVHALAAVGILSAVVRSKRALAATALRVIRAIGAIATLDAMATQPCFARRPQRGTFMELIAAFRAIGERAPPVRCISFMHRHLEDLPCRSNGGFSPQS